MNFVTRLFLPNVYFFVHLTAKWNEGTQEPLDFTNL